jgi:hypothetical protein
MRRIFVSLLAMSALAVVLAGVGAGTGVARDHRLTVAQRAAMGIDQRLLPNGLLTPALSGSFSTAAKEMLSASQGHAQSPDIVPPITPSSNGCPNVYTASGMPDNVRANQMCDFRRQAEEWVRENPADPSNVVVSQNDSRVGFNQTGIDFSLDAAEHFGDYAIPGQNARCGGAAPSPDAFSDPSHEFNSDGRMFYDAIGFDLFDSINGVYLWTSDPDAKGAYLHSPAGGFLSATPSAVAEECDPNSPISHDKQFTAVDPNNGDIYVMWTRFDFHCGDNADEFCESPIVFSKSTDDGVTWSPAVEVSGAADICKFGDAFDPTQGRHDCNIDQGAYPLVGPDGTVYVTFTNFNTFDQLINGGPVGQQLFVKSTDGGATWSAPVRVGLVDQSQPSEPVNGCPAGRRCLPPNGYRLASGVGSMGLDEKTGLLAVYWDDFRNGDYPANTNNDVFMAYSSDGGAHWNQTIIVSRSDPSNRLSSQPAAQWQAWGDVGANRKLYVAYYDRQYGDCDTSGCNDITLATSTNLGRTWSYQRITTASMPNLTAANNPVQAGFLGDYMSIQVVGDRVHIVWADTRGLAGTVEEDVYYATVPA